jgi:acyl carrier protein
VTNEETQLRAVIAAVIGVDASTITATAALHDPSAWDSLAHMSLIAAIEQEYRCTIEPELALELRSLDAIRGYLRGRGERR